MKTDPKVDAYEQLAARELEFEERQRRPIPDRLPDAGHVAGVAAGLSERFGVDVKAVRLVFVLLTLMSGIGPLAYLVLWVAMKPEGESTVSFRPRHVILAVSVALLISTALVLLMT